MEGSIHNIYQSIQTYCHVFQVDKLPGYLSSNDE